MLRMMIHLGAHNHHVADGKCQELVEETRRLIIEEFDRMPNAKVFLIPSVLARLSWQVTCLMILGMAYWSFLKVSSWSTSRTSSMNFVFVTFVTLLLLSNVI
jgi:hypothetical protein